MKLAVIVWVFLWRDLCGNDLCPDTDNSNKKQKLSVLQPIRKWFLLIAMPSWKCILCHQSFEALAFRWAPEAEHQVRTYSGSWPTPHAPPSVLDRPREAHLKGPELLCAGEWVRRAGHWRPELLVLAGLLEEKAGCSQCWVGWSVPDHSAHLGAEPVSPVGSGTGGAPSILAAALEALLQNWCSTWVVCFFMDGQLSVYTVVPSCTCERWPS